MSWWTEDPEMICTDLKDEVLISVDRNYRNEFDLTTNKKNYRLGSSQLLRLDSENLELEKMEGCQIKKITIYRRPSLQPYDEELFREHFKVEIQFTHFKWVALFTTESFEVRHHQVYLSQIFTISA